jgi:hypothetical protein
MALGTCGWSPTFILPGEGFETSRLMICGESNLLLYEFKFCVLNTSHLSIPIKENLLQNHLKCHRTFVAGHRILCRKNQWYMSGKFMKWTTYTGILDLIPSCAEHIHSLELDWSWWTWILKEFGILLYSSFILLMTFKRRWLNLASVTLQKYVTSGQCLDLNLKTLWTEKLHVHVVSDTGCCWYVSCGRNVALWQCLCWSDPCHWAPVIQVQVNNESSSCLV